jgi:hypothetical protein
MTDSAESDVPEYIVLEWAREPQLRRQYSFSAEVVSEATEGSTPKFSVDTGKGRTIC